MNFPSGFLNVVRTVNEENRVVNATVRASDRVELSNDMVDLDVSKVIFNRRERNVLYKICCYILYKMIHDRTLG